MLLMFDQCILYEEHLHEYKPLEQPSPPHELCGECFQLGVFICTVVEF